MATEFRLRLLGKPVVVDADGRVLDGLPKKAFLVATLAALAPRRSLAKAEIAEFLWPELPTARRANNLRQLLFRTRQYETAHRTSLFETDEDELRLSSGLPCDLVELGDVPPADPVAKVDRLLGIYRGRLLGDVRPSAPAMHRWLGDQRLQMEDQFVGMLLAVIEQLPAERRKEVLRQAIGLAPVAIGPRKALMRQHIADGSLEDARRVYREIQHVGGHGVVAAPMQLSFETVPAQAKAPGPAAVPLGQLGRDLAGVPHLALLPPRAGPGSGEEMPVAEALIDDVTVALTRLRSVSVLAAHSARKVSHGQDVGGSGLAHADFVLRTKITTGRIAGRGAGARLSLFLERTASGDIVWADGVVLDPEAGPMQFAAFANGIAMTLVDQVERSTLRAFQVPADAGAYGHYLLGQKALQVLDLPSTRRARASFKAALAVSPYFAAAHTGYAQSMIYEWVLRGRGDGDLVLHARRAAERAREIDPLFGTAHQMLGRASLFEGDFTASLAHFEQAEALNPHHADLLCDFADTLMHSSLAQRANDKIELALKLNPLAPDAYWWASAGIKFFVGEYEGALGHLSRLQNGEPVLRLTAACAAMAGQHELAKQARNRFLAIDPGFKLDDWIAVLPVRDPSHRRQYRQALHKAGFK